MNTQSKSAQNSEQTNTQAQTEQNQTTDNQAIKEKLGAFKTSRALIKLYNHAAPLLSDAELEHLSGAVFQAEMEADHMAKITESLGCLICDDENNGAFDNLTPVLLWQISNHYNLLSGLIQIGKEADFRLNNPDEVYLPRKQAYSGNSSKSTEQQSEQTDVHKKTD